MKKPHLLLQEQQIVLLQQQLQAQQKAWKTVPLSALPRPRFPIQRIDTTGGCGLAGVDDPTFDV